MPNHVMHFWKSDDFWKVGQCSTFLINHMWFFFFNIIKQVFLTNQKLEMSMPQLFKRECVVNFRKYRHKKFFWLGGVKMAKSNKNEKTEELVAVYQERECLWNELSSWYDWKLTANGLNKPKQKVWYVR